MNLKASQRGNARAMARHFLNAKDNDHIDIYDIRGLAGANLFEAFQEIEAQSKGTKCTQPFFTVSFNPPPSANLSYDQFEEAFREVETTFGLREQPRAVVFHEKEGRRHAHVSWSRIHTTEKTVKHTGETVPTLRAINLSHYKYRLQDVSRTLYQKFDLEMPKGYTDKSKRDPLNYDQTVWWQSKRLKEDPRDLKSIILTALESSDNRKSFQNALEQQGLFLANGRRGFVVLHHSGEAMALSRYSGYKTKELKSRLGDPSQLPTVEQAQAICEERLTATLNQMKFELLAKHRQERKPHLAAIQTMRVRQRDERASLRQTQEARINKETLVRANRLRKGISGMWDRITGNRGRVVKRNEQEIVQARQRDRQEQQQLIDRHLKERQTLQGEINKLKSSQIKERYEFRAKMGFLMSMDSKSMRDTVKSHIKERDEKRHSQDREDSGRVRERTRGSRPDDPSL